ncbi:TKL family protein kinase [Histomonas meleagridis]|uniref:TKL family protein kinase n=1 Tax=Histomonas meleagridis TaxID=135588 RepID=UPI003559E113|nr:TKL family protein kinase [Histomonas meleagridis]KAH0798911.1 TKL family protein kinase [Histomonas meleagridis]
MRTNLPNLFSALDHFQQLHSQCCSDVCGQIALTTSMRAVKGEINSIRKSCIKCLESIGFQPATQYLGLSDEELDLQDQVDIKRISVLLNQLQMRPDLSNRPDVSRHLQNRLNSLEDLGITISNDEREIVTIPDIPQSLNIVVKLSDIIMGEEIGSGQAGRVIHGILKPTNCEVAVKILHNRVLSSSDMEMFKREIFTMAVLRHPSLVRFYGYTSEPPFCILTEYMPNGSLYDFLHDHPDQLSPTERTLIALDIARGLEYLHGRGIIHRDLKSLNILLDQRKRAKICDFGLIRMKSSDPMTGLVGTACWMAPEVLISSPCYDEKVDVYSFGILLWELLTGERPYFDIDYGQLTFEIVEKNRRPIIPENVPKNLKELIEKCWERDPKLLN